MNSATVVNKKRMINFILQAVAEIPDRTSPEDQPEMLLVTQNELEEILEMAFEREAEIS